MPTLLQINVTANSGSHGKIAEEVGRLAMQNGWRSVIAYGRWANTSESELVRIGSDFDVKEHGIESRLLDNHGLASRKATKVFIKQIQEIKPDIIHFHNIHGYYLNYRLLFEYLNSSNIPIVWTLHDCWSFTGHCSHFVTASCEKWETGCTRCPLKKDYPKSFIDQSERNYWLKKKLFTSNRNLTLVPVCTWLGELIKKSFFQHNNVCVIENGVDINVFKPKAYHDDGKIHVLGVSGVWHKDKGLFDFYRLRDLLDQDRFKITMVGLTKNQIKDLPQGIRGIERTESMQELVDLYSLSDIYVNPTYADTFPTVNLEALACGTPVLTYRTGGSPDAITPETGWVVEQGAVENVAKIIKDLSDKSNEELASQHNLCRERAVTAFDKNKKFQAYLDLYNELLR